MVVGLVTVVGVVVGVVGCVGVDGDVTVADAPVNSVMFR